MTAPTEEAPSASTEKPAPAAETGPASEAFLDFLDLDNAKSANPSPTPPPARTRSRWWRIGFPLSLLLLFLAIPVLVYAGIHVVLDSNDGRLIASASDPSEPGWEAAVAPTPNDVLVTINDDGQLSSVAVMALTSDSTGAVLLVPADTQIPDTPGYKTMVDAYASGGPTG